MYMKGAEAFFPLRTTTTATDPQRDARAAQTTGEGACDQVNEARLCCEPDFPT